MARTVIDSFRYTCHYICNRVPSCPSGIDARVRRFELSDRTSSLKTDLLVYLFFTLKNCLKGSNFLLTKIHHSVLGVDIG